MKKSMFLFTAVMVLLLQSFTTQGAEKEQVYKQYGYAFENLDYLNKTLVAKFPVIMEKQVEKSFKYFNQGDFDSAIRCLNTSLTFLNNFAKRYSRLYLKPNEVSPFYPIRKRLKLISAELAKL